MEQTAGLRINGAGLGGPARPVLDDITVIIPTIGRPMLEKCLQSMASATVLPAWLVVIDQGENIAVASWIDKVRLSGLRTLHFRSTERSPASARNLAIGQVQTPLVAAIDDDCVVEKDWLEKMEGRLRENPKAIVTGRLEPAGDGIPPTAVTSRIPKIYRRPSIRNLSPLASANMGFALRTARQIGLFDGTLFAAEENDWAYRALCAGVPIIYAPELIVYHIHWRDKRELAATYRSYAWSQGIFYGKHLRQGRWSMFLRTAISLFRGARILTVGVVKNDYGRRVNGYARITHLLPGVVAGWRGLDLPR